MAIDGGMVKTVTNCFLGSKITADADCSHEIKRCLLLGRKVMTNLDSILKTRDIANKGPYSQAYGFSSSHVWMWELEYKESCAPKNWYFQTVVLEKTLESPLDSKEIKPVHPQGNQPWRSPCCPNNSQGSSPTPQFESICSSLLSFLYGPTLTSIHDHWRNHRFDYMNLCWQSNVSAF